MNPRAHFFALEIGPNIKPTHNNELTTMLYENATGSEKIENFLQTPPIKSKFMIKGSEFKYSSSNWKNPKWCCLKPYNAANILKLSHTLIISFKKSRERI